MKVSTLEIDILHCTLHLSFPQPSFLVQLDVQKPNPDADAGEESVSASKTESVLLQSDYANLRMLSEGLSAAVKEMKTSHCRRIARYIR